MRYTLFFYLVFAVRCYVSQVILPLVSGLKHVMWLDIISSVPSKPNGSIYKKENHAMDETLYSVEKKNCYFHISVLILLYAMIALMENTTVLHEFDSLISLDFCIFVFSVSITLFCVV